MAENIIVESMNKLLKMQLIFSRNIKHVEALIKKLKNNQLTGSDEETSSILSMIEINESVLALSKELEADNLNDDINNMIKILKNKIISHLAKLDIMKKMNEEKNDKR